MKKYKIVAEETWTMEVVYEVEAQDEEAADLAYAMADVTEVSQEILEIDMDSGPTIEALPDVALDAPNSTPTKKMLHRA